MKKSIGISLLFFMAVSYAVAEPGAAPAPGGTVAIIFDLKNLPLAIAEFEDTYQAGVGIKWWVLNSLALRGLARFDVRSFETVTTTAMGLSAGAEWHPVRRKISPYVGGFLGARATIDTENRVDVYFGGLGGMEVLLWDNLSFYAEYNLLASIDSNGFSLSLGGDNSAQLGLLIYF